MNTTPNRYLVTTCRAVTCVFASTVAAALFGQTHATDQGTTTTTTARSADHSNLKHADRSFVEKAAQSGREEVEIARVAVERSQSPDVKQFAQMMIDDHTKANQQLEQLATARGIKLKEKDKAENKWSKKDAKDFDRDFIKKMVSDHKKDIDLFSKESKNGGDSELVDFARTTLPTLEKHLEAVSALEKTTAKH